MSSLVFRRFTDSAALREAEPAILVELLRPHAEFLARHGCRLPADGEGLNHAAVETALLLPRPDMPPDLVDALWHIHEMATPHGMELLIEAAVGMDLELAHDGRYSPADVAVRLWLADPEVVRRKHAEQSVLKRTSYETFTPREGSSLVCRPPDAGLTDRMEVEAAAWYAEQLRGPGARVFVFEADDEVRIIFRHGGPYRREGKLDAGEPGSVHFRPLVFSVAVFKRRTWELRINCGAGGGKREMQFLRECIGQHLFGQRDFFPSDVPRYNLEPLRRDGARSLTCTDVPGVRHVRLVGLRIYHGGPFHRAIREEADDVFLALEHDGAAIPNGALLTEAVLEFCFADSPKPRRATIRHGNKTRYSRGGDGDLIEAFLCARGFVQGVAHAALAIA